MQGNVENIVNNADKAAFDAFMIDDPGVIRARLGPCDEKSLFFAQLKLHSRFHLITPEAPPS